MIVNGFFVSLQNLHIFNKWSVIVKEFVGFDQKRLDKLDGMNYNGRRNCCLSGRGFTPAPHQNPFAKGFWTPKNF